MIRNDEQLKIEQRQLAIVEEIVESWRQKLLPHNPKNFALYAEGAIEQADLLRAEINEYLARKKTQAPQANGVQMPVAGNPTTAS